MISSKAETLRYLAPLLKKSKIENMYYFSVNDWKENERKILADVSKLFKTDIIIRSSATGEDSLISSQAGLYKSVLNINPKKKNIVKNGINEVIKSYQKGKDLDKNNQPEKLHSIARQRTGYNDDQVLIQKQTKLIDTSGVILSRDPNSGAPYFIINFEQDNSTDSVTKGISNNMIKIYRNTKEKYIPEHWKKLINSIKEIEKILKVDKLDIEFAINKKNEIIIFQVRVLTQLFGRDYTTQDYYVKRKLNDIISNFQKKNNQNSLLSDMADWNPSEIIGTNPNPLSYSLYDFLIMNHSWCKGRENLGYQKPISRNLMHKIGNKPYVRLQNSFTSFFPKSFPEKLKKKLLRYYIKKIENNSFLHDKIEFYIIFSCFDMSVPNRLKEMRQNGFTKKETEFIQKEVTELTNNLILNFNTTLNNCQKSIDKLETKRNGKELQRIAKNFSNKELLIKTESLLKDCKSFGTIPFATMARLAFVASALLKSMLDQKIISSDQYYSIFSTVNSPMIEFQKDLQILSKKHITKKKFLEKYGHLRPGTYDITIKRYDEKEIETTSNNFKKEIKQNITKNAKIDKNLKKYGLKFNFNQLISFIRETLYYREKFKMEFTKNISELLELILKIGEKNNFTREEISFLEINSILSAKNKSNIIANWKKEIDKNKNVFLKNEFLLLPPFISKEKNVFVIENFRSKPNFITKKSVTANIIQINKNIIQNVRGKIIAIENADPGFDWIFSKNPAGLVTKYGGVASHMAIRCSEIGLPAVIGCDQTIFSRIEAAKRMKLDCKKEQISFV